MSPTNTVDVADSRTKFVFVSDADKQIFQNSLTPLLRSLFKDYFTYLHSNLESKDFIKYYYELIDTQKPGKSEKFIQTAFENNGFNWDSSILDGVTDPTYLLGRLLYSKLYKAHYRNDDGRNAALKYSIDEVYEMEDGATVTFKQQVNTLRIIRNMFHHSADTTYQDAKNPLLPNRYPHLKATLCDENDAASWVLDDTSIATCINTFNLMLNIFPGQKNSAEIREKVKTLTEKIAHLERWKVGRESAPFKFGKDTDKEDEDKEDQGIKGQDREDEDKEGQVLKGQNKGDKAIKKEQPVLIAQRITSQSPQYLIFLVDESGSMGSGTENNSHGSKGEQVVSAITDTLMALYSNQLRGNEGVKDYFYVSVLGYYGSTKGPIVEDLVVFDEDVEEAIKTAEIRTLTTIAEWGVEDNFIKFKAGGTTPMKEAFEKARDLIQFWHKNADEIVKQENPELTTSTDTYHPPIILSISDGRYDDTESGETLDKSKSPAKVIEEIQNTAYPKFYDKPVIMNIHISDKKDAEQVIFPDAIEDKKDEYLQEMFNLSSYLTDNMVAVGINQGFYPNISKNSKAFIYNAPLSELQKILLLGTSRTRTSITGLTSTPDDVGV